MGATKDARDHCRRVLHDGHAPRILVKGVEKPTDNRSARALYYISG